MHPLGELRLKRRLSEIEHNAKTAMLAAKKGDPHDMIPRLLRAIASTAVAALLEVKSYYDQAEGTNGAGEGPTPIGPAESHPSLAGAAPRGPDGGAAAGTDGT